MSEWKEGAPVVWKGAWQGRAYEDHGTTLPLDRERLIRFTPFSPSSGLPDVAENRRTITIRLAKEGSATRADLTQDNSGSQEARAHFEDNWNGKLGRLKVLAEGQVPPAVTASGSSFPPPS